MMECWNIGIMGKDILNEAAKSQESLMIVIPAKAGIQDPDENRDPALSPFNFLTVETP